MKTRTIVGFLLALAITAVIGTKLLRDSDNDGVADFRDDCPETAQLQMLPPTFKFAPAVNPDRLRGKPQAYPVDDNGCEPDSDKDGIIDSMDYCPDDSAEAIALGVTANGCPLQSDLDGTPDYRDHCPGTPAGIPTDQFGCEK